MLVGLSRRHRRERGRLPHEVRHRELCQTHGLDHKQVKHLLLSVGIDTAFYKDEVHAMAFDRAEIEEASVKKERFWAYDRSAVRRSSQNSTAEVEAGA